MHVGLATLYRSAAFALVVSGIAVGNGAAGLTAPATTLPFALPTQKAIDGAIADWFAKYKALGVIVGIQDLWIGVLR
jgi:hypothetical protein